MSNLLVWTMNEYGMNVKRCSSRARKRMCRPHEIHALLLLGTEDSTIRRLVPGVTTGFLKGAETRRQRSAHYLVAMTRVLFSIRTDSIWDGSWNLSRFWGESNS